MSNVVVRAAQEFMKDEQRRKARHRFSEEERRTLRWHLETLVSVPRTEGSNIHSRRGFAAVDLIGYQGVDSEDGPVNVIADILHHAEAVGLDPMTVMAHARAEFYRDKGVDDAS